MSDPLLGGCRDLTAAAAAYDGPSFHAALSVAHGRIAGAEPADRHAAMRHLGSHLERLDPEYASWAALLAGALAECGAEPTPVVRPILSYLKTVAEAAAYFADAWQDATDRPLPEPEGTPPETVWTTVSPALYDATAVAVESWWSLPRWTAAARAVLSAPSVPWTGLSGTDRALLLRVLGLAAVYRPEPREVRDLLAAAPA